MLEVNLVLYTAKPALRITRLDDLAQRGPLLAEFRRGVGVCESALKQWLPAANVSNVTVTAQALRKLVEGRTDVFCDFDLAVVDAVNSSELADLGRFSRLFDVGAPVQFYGYLHKKHAALAPRLAETLKKMKAEGLIERYRVESEKDSMPKR